ncbi:hydroxymethylglutaryl-CoA synthase [uncultured Sneathia sp.]|jgi:hydroxymethylglutaryl-coA synthase|uniref:hydroxymethylglutaryl-CoA synthase n=1 Tax=uncultured Sneathia sp. TaxID=278067 RepID=UPI0025914E3D|nr:hydroxymethylglutaryl-CoA synthase [uncultured Sneathia sp.]
MKIGIDKMGIYIPRYYLDIRDLAKERNIDPDKFVIGLGQSKMSVNPISQDIVTFGVLAADKILTDEDKKKIDMLIVGTETGVDQSKSASAFMHSILGINEYCRSIEIKQACYGATAALQVAKNHILVNPDSKVLVIASDIAKYGINTSGESTQGCGAVAMLVSKDPKMLEISNESVCYTKDVMDFFRPNNSTHAIVNGKLSTNTYLESLEKVYYEFSNRFGEKNFSAICFHIPYPKLGLKGLKEIKREDLLEEFNNSIMYNKEIGNIYTGSLFLSLISLLENSKKIKANDLIGLYSYGSGAVSEFFTMKVVEGYKKYLSTKENQKMLENRVKLSVSEYEEMFFSKIEHEKEIENKEGEDVYLKGIFNNERTYARKI